jgi:hypothetical protein
MASIYSNADFTLAATKSSGCTEGCFVASKPSYRSRIWNLQDNEGNKFDVHSRVALYHGDIERLPLMKRGWVLQEKLVSPRMLHFTEEELVFDCSEMHVCKCSVRPLWNTEFAKQAKFWKKLPIHEADAQWHEV